MWRVYPQGVSGAQTSQRVKGLAALLYLLGLSYGATSLALEALGVCRGKTRVYDVVQAAAERAPGMTRTAVFSDIRTPALGRVGAVPPGLQEPWAAEYRSTG